MKIIIAICLLLCLSSTLAQKLRYQESFCYQRCYDIQCPYNYKNDFFNVSCGRLIQMGIPCLDEHCAGLNVVDCFRDYCSEFKKYPKIYFLHKCMTEEKC